MSMFPESNSSRKIDGELERTETGDMDSYGAVGTFQVKMKRDKESRQPQKHPGETTAQLKSDWREGDKEMRLMITQVFWPGGDLVLQNGTQKGAGLRREKGAL